MNNFVSCCKKTHPQKFDSITNDQTGKLIKPTVADTTHRMIIDAFSFDFSNLSWTVLPQTVEFTVENAILEKVFFKSSTGQFSGAIGKTHAFCRCYL